MRHTPPRPIIARAVDHGRYLPDVGTELMHLAYLRFLILDLRHHLAAKAGYDPNQPRDEAGRWADTGGGEPDVIDSVLRNYQGTQIDDAAYMGEFHDIVRDNIVADLRAAGAVAETEVDLTLPGEHPITARIDILAKTPGGELRGIEVKTGAAPDFTLRQKIVCFHAMTSDTIISVEKRISNLGLIPNMPISRFDIDVAYAPGLSKRIIVLPGKLFLPKAKP